MENQDKFFESDGLLTHDLAEAQISKETLVAILNDFLKNQENLKNQASYFANILLMGQEINSVKWRVKDPIHLLKKIVRKRKDARKNGEENSDYLNINVDNYKMIVNDLIGLRAIYLFKADWHKINSFILSNFKVSEDIIFYHANLDDPKQLPEDGVIVFQNTNYNLKKDIKPSEYRSTHYLIEGIFPLNIRFELQTRTILEEAWGEIDHHIRYPDFQHDKDLKRKMTKLNQALSHCEDMVSADYAEFEELKVKLKKQVEENTLALSHETEKQITCQTEVVTDEVRISDKIWDNRIRTIENIDRYARLSDNYNVAKYINNPALTYMQDTALTNSNIATSSIPNKLAISDNALKTFEACNLAINSALKALRTSELSNLVQASTLAINNELERNHINDIFKSPALKEIMKAQKQRDDLMKSVHSTYSEYDKSINSLYKLPNLSDNQDDD